MQYFPFVVKFARFCCLPFFLSFPDHLLCLYVCEGDEGRTAGRTAGRRLFSGEDGGSSQDQEEGRRFRRQDQVTAARSFPGLPHFFYIYIKKTNGRNRTGPVLNLSFS